MSTRGRSLSPAGWRTSALVAALVGALLCAAYPLRWLDGLETKLADLRFWIRGERAPCPSVVIIAIDDPTLSEYPDLPLDPQLNARLVRRLTAAGVSAIGLDLAELARPTSGQADAFRELTAAVGASRRAVLPTVVPHAGKDLPASVSAPVRRFAAGPGRLVKPVGLSDSALVGPRAELCAAAAGLGALNVYPDPDWTVRSAPLLFEVQGALYPSFAVELARVALGRPPGAYSVPADGFLQVGGLRVPMDEAGQMVISFAGPDGTYPALSYRRIVERSGLPADLAKELRGKVAIVGATGAALPSRLRTPFSPYMAGVEVTANAVGTLLDRRFLPRPSVLEGVLLTLAGALLGFLLGSMGRPWRAAALTALALVSVLAVWATAFARGACLPMAGPVLALGLVASLLITRTTVGQYYERRRDLDQIASRVGALAGMGDLLNSGLHRQQLLTSIMVWVEEEVGCEAASLILLDEHGRLRFEVALGPVGDRLKDVTMEVGEGIVGTVVADNQPLLVPDTEKDPRFAKTIAQAVDFPARSILCVPMTVQGRVVGAIEVINKRDGSLFSEHDVALLSVIAQHAAMFLETARLYEVLERRVDLANEELRVTNRELSTEKAKVEAIVDHMADGVVAADEGGRIVLLNDAAEEMLGLTAREALGRQATEALPYPELVQLFRPQGGEGAQTEVTLGESAERIVRARSALAVDQGVVAGRVVVLSDITDLRELDRTKTDMVSFVSHELKNPLTSITGFAALIRDRLAEATSAEYADIISRQAGRMSRMIGDFLNIARIDMGRRLEMHWRDDVDVRAVAEEAVEAEAPGRPDHQFVVDVAPEVPAIRADPDKLYQVLVNLVNNAAKYSPRGGTVTVNVAPGDDDEIRFAVRDQGMGIAPESMQHLFKRFRRVRDGSGDRIEGTGLGLFLTRHLIEAHGGRIWAESTPGEGSTFRFVLPTKRQTSDEQDP